MAWQGINTSGIAFALDTHFLSAGTIQWVGDTLTGVNADFNFALPPPRFGWRITPTDPQNFRVTVTSFSGPGYEPGDGEAIVRTLSMTLLEQNSDTSFAVINAESGPGATFLEYGPPSIPEDIIVSSFQFLIEVEVPDPPPVLPDCDEPGQVTRCYVSTFDQPRIHESRLFQQGKRCLEANFNGAIGVGRTIVAAKWSMQTPYSVVMDTARITADQRSTRVNITAAWTGDAWMRAQVTLDNGEIYTQLFHVVVPPSPWFGDVSPTAGPSELTASAP